MKNLIKKFLRKLKIYKLKEIYLKDPKLKIK